MTNARAHDVLQGNDTSRPLRAAMPTRAIAGPAAWTGAEQRSRRDWVYHFSAADIAELRRATASVVARGLGFATITPRTFELPVLGPKLKLLADDVQFGRGFVLMRGFPLDLPQDQIERMYFGLMSHMGFPIAQNHHGELMVHVRDDGAGYNNKVRSYRSNHLLTYHADWSDMVALACVRPAAEGGISRIISAVTIHNVLFEQHREVLEELYSVPFYMDWKNEGPDDALPYFWVRIFSWFDEKLSTYYINRVMRDTHAQRSELPPLTALQDKGLDLIEAIGQRSELALDMEFRPGDIQVLNNYSVWHSRTQYTDHADPALKRHLLRVWLAEPCGRLLAPSFTNRYEALGVAGQVPRMLTFPQRSPTTQGGPGAGAGEAAGSA